MPGHAKRADMGQPARDRGQWGGGGGGLAGARPGRGSNAPGIGGGGQFGGQIGGGIVNGTARCIVTENAPVFQSRFQGMTMRAKYLKRSKGKGPNP